jgi:hypothetical protein
VRKRSRWQRAQNKGDLVLQLRLHIPPVVSPTCLLVVAYAPSDPLQQESRGSLSEEYSAGQEVADRIHRNTKLRRTVHEATLRSSGLLSFRLLDASIIEARNRSARSLARKAAAAITRVPSQKWWKFGVV